MKTIRLGDLAAIDISNVDKKAKAEETSVTLCNFVDVYHNWIIDDSNTRSLMQATARQTQIERFSLRHGQVAITKDSETRDDIGIPTFIDKVPDKTVLGYHCALITPIANMLDGAYLNCILQTDYAKKYFECNASGSGQRYTLTVEVIADFPVPLPPLDEQIKRAEIFTAIHRALSNSQSICSDLEAAAKLLYDYWFVQFDFPDENGKPYKSSGGKMVWSDKLRREIPEGFEPVELLDTCSIIDCLHSKKPEFHFESEQFYLLSLENLTKDGYVDCRNKYFISKEDYERWTNNVVTRENDFVITNAGRAGDVVKIPSDVTCAIGRNLTLIRPKAIDPYYLRQFFKSPYFRQQVTVGLDTGSFFNSFNVHAIKKLVVLKPSEQVCRNYCKIIKPMISLIEQLLRSNQELSSLRDFLLPLLMNGQVTIGNDGK